VTVPCTDDCTAGRDDNPALSAAAIRIFQMIRALPGTSVQERSGERMQEGLQQKAFTPEQYKRTTKESQKDIGDDL